MLPKPIQDFIDLFSKLPSIGPRLASRLAFHIISLGKSERSALEEALRGIHSLDRCDRCFFPKLPDEKFCIVCSDEKRDARTVAFVEKETDLLSLERTGKFRGVYLVLGELPERGVVEPFQKLRLQRFKKYVQEYLDGNLDEIILALTPNTFGDFMEELVRQEFGSMTKRITHLGRGIPTGGEIEFADEDTLGSALERRSE